MSVITDSHSYGQDDEYQIQLLITIGSSLLCIPNQLLILRELQ
jgi:hypothetical protein